MTRPPRATAAALRPSGFPPPKYPCLTETLQVIKPKCRTSCGIRQALLPPPPDSFAPAHTEVTNDCLAKIFPLAWEQLPGAMSGYSCPAYITLLRIGLHSMHPGLEHIHSPECPPKFPGTPPSRCQSNSPTAFPHGFHLQKETYTRTPLPAAGWLQNCVAFRPQFLQFGWQSGNIGTSFKSLVQAVKRKPRKLPGAYDTGSVYLYTFSAANAAMLNERQPRPIHDQQEMTI